MHMPAMTELLERAIAAARRLPPEAQDEIARSVLFLAGEETGPVLLSEEESASMVESLTQAARAEFATDEEVAAVFAKHGL